MNIHILVMSHQSFMPATEDDGVVSFMILVDIAFTLARFPGSLGPSFPMIRGRTRVSVAVRGLWHIVNPARTVIAFRNSTSLAFDEFAVAH